MAIYLLSYRAMIKANRRMVPALCSHSIRNIRWVIRVWGGYPSATLHILYAVTVSNRRESTRRNGDLLMRGIWKTQSNCKWSATQPTLHHLEIKSMRVPTMSGRFKLGSRCLILMKLLFTVSSKRSLTLTTPSQLTLMAESATSTSRNAQELSTFCNKWLTTMKWWFIQLRCLK